MSVRLIPKGDVRSLLRALEMGFVVQKKPGLKRHFLAHKHACAGLTPKARDTLDFIAAYIAQYGYSPSYEEIARGLGIASKGEIHRRVRLLELRGQITRLAGRARSIRIVTPMEQVVPRQPPPGV